MKNISSIIFILLFCSFLMGSAYAEDVSGDVSISVDNNNQQVFTEDGTSLTISESTTLSTDSSQTVNIFM